MKNWITTLKLAVEDPGVFYRVFYCENCQSLRYHRVVRLKIMKVETVWWVWYYRRCNGLPPVIPFKRERLIKECGLEIREWIIASQWNALVRVNAYAP